MMVPVHRIDGRDANPVYGNVRPDWRKISWNGPLLLGALAAPFFWNGLAVLCTLAATYVLLLFGHSIGLHRLLIHRSFDAKPWLSRTLLYLGALVGIDSPSRIIALHDTRDWAQREPQCHDFFSHRRPFWRDLTWQLFYTFEFDHPPALTIEVEWAQDPVFRHLTRYWRFHQIALGGILFLFGGWAWLLWGMGFRISLVLLGHWSVTYICHNPGPTRWHVNTAGVQASDLRAPLAAFLTQGECWHSNHHAFPESARIGLHHGQADPAARVIEWMAKPGWVTRIGRPRPEQRREDLTPLPALPSIKT